MIIKTFGQLRHFCPKNAALQYTFLPIIWHLQSCLFNYSPKVNYLEIYSFTMASIMSLVKSMALALSLYCCPWSR